MNWQELRDYLDDQPDDGDVIVTILLSRFPEFPRHRLGGYVKPSGEPTVAVSHLQTVVERYGDVDGDGHGGPRNVDNDDEGLQIAHNTTVPLDNREYEGSMVVEADGLDESVVEKIKELGTTYECDTAE